MCTFVVGFMAKLLLEESMLAVMHSERVGSSSMKIFAPARDLMSGTQVEFVEDGGAIKC